MTKLVFKVELPLELAPTLNGYASKLIGARGPRRFAMHGLNERVDEAIEHAKRRWPTWDMGIRRWSEPVIVLGKVQLSKRGKVQTRKRVEGGRRRLVRVFRFSSVEPDEVSCDVIGGKLPIDRLKHAGVIRDDSRQWLAREAFWRSAPPKGGRVVIEVFDLET